MESVSRETYLRANLVRFAEESFPDDTGLDWIIHGFDHQSDLTWIEVEPRPDQVGYARLQFVVSFEDRAQPTVAGCYALKRDSWGLLFDDGSKRKLPRKMPR